MDKKIFKIPEKQESEVELKENVLEAIKSRNVDQTIGALQALNQELTGFASSHFSAGAGIESLKQDIEKFFQETVDGRESSMIISLGDGGMSRLLVSAEENGEVNIDLTNNATPEVKDKWDIIK